MEHPVRLLRALYVFHKNSFMKCVEKTADTNLSINEVSYNIFRQKNGRISFASDVNTMFEFFKAAYRLSKLPNVNLESV